MWYPMHMALQNRVDPLGRIVATAARGALMGNRGGRIHRDDRSLGPRRWASKAWIACQTDFGDRHREVMGRGYTELFFLDEATALAAGHRPCFECRRADARAFAEAMGRAVGAGRPLRAAEIDARLHAERVRPRRAGGVKRLAPIALADAPVGAMIMLWGRIWLVAPAYLLRWTFGGYVDALDRRGFAAPAEQAFLLTPPSTAAALAAGYRPDAASTLY